MPSGSGYRVSFAGLAEESDAPSRPKVKGSEKRWTVAATFQEELKERYEQRIKDRTRWTWAGEKVKTLGEEVKEREFLLRTRRKQTQELFTEALGPAEEALRMAGAVDRQHSDAVKLKAMRSACLSFLQNKFNQLSQKQDLKGSLLLSVLKDHGWIEGTDMVPGHFDPPPDLKAFVKKLRFWAGEAEPRAEAEESEEEEDASDDDNDDDDDGA